MPHVTLLAFGPSPRWRSNWSTPQEREQTLKEQNRPRTFSVRNSATGTRTRVARVRAEYPNQLDYSGSALFTLLLNIIVYKFLLQKHSLILLPKQIACVAIRILNNQEVISSISGLVVEYIVAIDVARVRFPADAFCGDTRNSSRQSFLPASSTFSLYSPLQQ